MNTEPAERALPVELRFTRTNGDIDVAIDGLIHMVGDVHHPDIIREMILAALKSGRENEETADLKLMNSTLKEMRYTAKVFGPYRETKKVTVFGSARVKPGARTYQMAQLVGQKLAESGHMVITGGGPGIMQAVNEGAGHEKSFGVSIRLPFENQPNPVLAGSPRSIIYKYFFNRKVAFIKEADAVALFPGGLGTLDEAMEVLTLLQTGKRYPIPLMLIDEPGGTYWSSWRRFIENELLERSYIDSGDFNFFEVVDSASTVVEIIDRFYSRYHSMRFVGERLVIRLNSPLDEEWVKELNRRFGDILIPGGSIWTSTALPEEDDEPGIVSLQRIVLDFSRKNYSRLRQLIDAINMPPRER